MFYFALYLFVYCLRVCFLAGTFRPRATRARSRRAPHAAPRALGAVAVQRVHWDCLRPHLVLPQNVHRVPREHPVTKAKKRCWERRDNGDRNKQGRCHVRLCLIVDLFSQVHSSSQDAEIIAVPGIWLCLLLVLLVPSWCWCNSCCCC